MTHTELKALRKKLGLNLTQAAHQVGVNASTWSRWERGEVRMTEGLVRLFTMVNKKAIAALEKS